MRLWTGIGGWNDEGDVLQAGIYLSLNPSGVATYNAWVEWWGDNVVGSVLSESSFPIREGDYIHVYVAYLGANGHPVDKPPYVGGTITIANHTTGQWVPSIILEAPLEPTDGSPSPPVVPLGASAEWILEELSSAAYDAVLPKFGTIEMSGGACPDPSLWPLAFPNTFIPGNGTMFYMEDMASGAMATAFPGPNGEVSIVYPQRPAGGTR